MSWIKPLCIGLAVLVGARISSVNHLGQLSEIICEAVFGSLVCGSLARSLSFCHPFFDPPYLLPTPTPKRNTVRFLGRYFQVWYASASISLLQNLELLQGFPCNKFHDSSVYYVLHFLQTLSVLLEVTFKGYLFIVVSQEEKEDWSCEINVSCRRKVSFF